jgi:diguanylate cyclase (GGDEF)-like protein
MTASRDRTLGVKLLLLVVGSYIMTLAAMLAGSVYLTHDRMISDRVIKLQAVVELAETTARLLENDVAANRLTRADAIERFRNFVYATRYNGESYLFANTLDGTIIAVGNDPAAQGRNRLDLKDATGKPIIQEILAKVRGGGSGVVRYWYPRKPGEPPLLKLVYVKAFAPWNAFIGTGVYIDDIDAAFRTYLLDVAAVVLAGLAIAGALATSIGREVAASVSERRAAEAEIIHLAHHDTLTGLANRANFNDTLKRAVTRATDDPADGVALLLCDLDRFKEVNDTYGHPAGDELLRQASARMLATIRKEDLLARLGGDEFAFALMATRHSAESDSLARRVVDVLSQPFVIHGHSVTVGVSVGIAMAPVHATNPVELMQQADTALYVSKHSGGSVATVYDPAMSQSMQERYELKADLRRASGGGEFLVLYQPIIDLPARRVVAFEALIRWQHPVRGLLGPDAFLEAAEESGLLADIGNGILRRACLDAAAWDAGMRVAVNVSSQQLLAEDFPAVVKAALNDAGLAADRLELEIPERAMLTDTEAVRSALTGLRTLGVRISLDHFGTGYTSLSYLQQFPINRIKIDRSYVRDISSAAAETIVRAVVGLGTILGIRTLAEGIETEDQAERASAARCDEGQGFLFSRPVPVEEVAAVIDRFARGTPAMETA